MIIRTTSVAGWNRLVTRRTTIPAAVVLIVVGMLLVVWGDDDGSGPSVTGVVVFVVVVAVAALVLVFVVNTALQLAGFDGEASEIADHLATDPDQRRLLARWLARARWARFVGGFCGFLVWILGTQMRGDLLLLGTGGIAVGATLAELHHIRPRKGPRTARLDVRSVGDYVLRQDARRMLGVGLVACGVAIAGAVAGVVTSEATAAIWWGLTAAAVLGAARLAQERVAGRPRPAVSDKLTRADDLARELAIGRGLARPATFFALALVARGCYALVPAVGNLGGVLGGAAWLYALYLWWHNRRLGLDFLLTDARDPVLS